jgi:hypothetical protein
MKILVFDVETSPIVAYTWGLFDQNVGLNQIREDWHLLAWSAKWLGDAPSKTMYMDNSRARNIRDDKQLVVGLSKLLNEADVIITQNGDAFDVKKLNARAIINRLPPVKSVRSIDILKEGRKVFKFTSHKLEYITSVLNDKYTKLKHKEYPGFELWSAILKGDKRAWAVMKKYCMHDVLSTEEAYTKLAPWIKTGRVTDKIGGCKCGSDKLQARGWSTTMAGKYPRYQCQDCGKWLKGAVNLHTTEQRKSIMREGK